MCRTRSGLQGQFPELKLVRLTGHMETLQSSGVVEYETVDEGYFEQRQLKRGAAGWMLLVGLGVAYVISGDFAGWNFGLKSGTPLSRARRRDHLWHRLGARLFGGNCRFPCRSARNC